MATQVSKWGNSLAVRLPADCVRELNLQEGDTMQVELTDQGTLILKPQVASRLDKSEVLKLVERLQQSLPTTPAVVELMRQTDRY